MSDLRYYGDELLKQEMARRQRDRGQGICDYCGKPGTDAPCSRADRHSLAVAGDVAGDVGGETAGDVGGRGRRHAPKVAHESPRPQLGRDRGGDQAGVEAKKGD